MVNKISLEKMKNPTVFLIGIFILSLMPFILVQVFHSSFYMKVNINSYLVFHNISEFFSVIVSLSIFGLGWFSYNQNRDHHALFLSTAFMAIGLMDFMHTSGYQGMPDFFTPNTPDKSTQFWIAVRFYTASVFLLSAFIYKEKKYKWISKLNLIIPAIGISSIVFTGIIFFPDFVPDTFTEGVGLTPFKKNSEYLIIFILILAAGTYWKRMLQTGDKNLIFYIAAFILCILSELAFTFYKSAFDTYNMLGHMYKVLAFFLIYKGIFVTSINLPYEKLQIEILERKKAEEAIKYQNTLLSTQQEASIDGILVVDEHGNIVSYNRRFMEIWGISGDIIESRDDEKVLNSISDKLSDPDEFYNKVELLYKNKNQISRDEILFKNGQVLDRYSAPVIGENNKYYGRIWYFRDITERKDAEETLRETNTYLENLLSYANVPIIVWDTNFCITRFNHAFEILTGRKAEDVIGKSIELLFPENFVETAMKLIKSTITGERWETVDIQIINKKAEIKNLLWNSANIYASDGKTLVSTIAQGYDITERKIADEKIIQSLREKETLIKELYHRTKNTMQVINAMISLQASEFSKNDELQQLVTNTENRIQAISLVHQMLYKSQDLSHISIKEYILELANLILQSFCETKIINISLDVQIEDKSFLIDTVIPFGLILNELMTNSIKYAFPDNRDGIISISLNISEPDKNIFQYRDNGIGFKPDFNFRNQNTLGTKLIYSIGELQMMGRVNMFSKDGFNCTVEFPDNLYKSRV